MKRILVTGGAGFIGSAFARWQLRRYPTTHIVVLDKLTYSGNLDNLKDADPQRYTFIRGDVADPKTVAQALDGCDGVAHFAAESHVDRSLAGAEDFIATNVSGGNALLEQAVAETVRWYQENEWWWRKIKSGDFKEYYARQYNHLLDG